MASITTEEINYSVDPIIESYIDWNINGKYTHLNKPLNNL